MSLQDNYKVFSFMPVYHIGGFTIKSPIELPNISHSMIKTSPVDALDIEIKGIPSYKTSQPPIAIEGGEVQWVEDGFRLFHRRVGEMLLLKDTVYWQQSDPTDVPGFRTFLLNTLLPAYAVLKGFLSLHISAISFEGRAIAFQGNSGAGKSTLAAMLMKRGFPVLTEDLGIVEMKDDTAVMRPGVPCFRLWKQTFRHIDETPQKHNLAWAHRGKYYRDIEAENFCSEQQPIYAMYFLREPEDGKEISIKAISGFKAASAILHSNFFGVPQNSDSESKTIFNDVMVLANQIKCFELIRPKDYAMAEQVCDALIKHWKTS